MSTPDNVVYLSDYRRPAEQEESISGYQAMWQPVAKAGMMPYWNALAFLSKRFLRYEQIESHVLLLINILQLCIAGKTLSVTVRIDNIDEVDAELPMKPGWILPGYTEYGDKYALQADLYRLTCEGYITSDVVDVCPLFPPESDRWSEEEVDRFLDEYVVTATVTPRPGALMRRLRPPSQWNILRRFSKQKVRMRVL